MDLLEKVNSGLNKFDVRTVNGQEVIPMLKSFSTEAELLDTDKNQSKENGLIRYIDKRILKLEQSLEGNWNISLPRKDDSNDWEFFKAEDEKKSYTCEEEDCSSTFTNGQSFQRHLKKKHKIKRKVEMPTVTCRLVHKSGRDEQIVNHQIAAHLNFVHGVQKPSVDHYFRGFVRSGGVFIAVFLPLEAADPSNPNLEFSPQIDANHEAVDRGDGSADDNNIEDVRMSDPGPSRGLKRKIDSPDFRGYTSGDGQTFTEVFKSPDYEKRDGDNSKKMRRRCIDVHPITDFSGEEENLSSVDNEEDKGQEEEPVNIDADISEEDKGQEEVPGLIPVDISDFSDVEETDSQEYTEDRIKNKLYRYHLRETETKPSDLCNQEGNKEFIRECTDYILKKNLSRNSKKSNLDKSTGHLFRYEDSLLNYLTKNIPGFTLSRLVSFKDRDQFLKIQDPMLTWIKETGGESGLENPSRQREQLKGHADIRKFLIRKLKETDFGNDLHDILWSGKIREHIEQISEDIEQSGVWRVLNKLEEQSRKKIQIAKEIINPEDNLKELNALKVYFSSEKFREREVKLEKSFQNSVRNNDVTHRDGYDVGNFGRVLLGKQLLFIRFSI